MTLDNERRVFEVLTEKNHIIVLVLISSRLTELIALASSPNRFALVIRFTAYSKNQYAQHCALRLSRHGVLLLVLVLTVLRLDRGSPLRHTEVVAERVVRRVLENGL